ncbi:MAG TPA: ABC transporter permease [Vicinamibacterales bacterium]|nr:ABC transporter permease [Vicinamibacterales bacterium]
MTPRGSVLSWFVSLVRNLFGGGRRDAELRSDIDTYIDMLVDEKIAAGLSPEAARRSTLLELGSVDHIKDNARSVRAGALLAEIASDARYALRMMRRDWTFSAIALVTLALGIGANTAIFSIVNGVLLKPLPYPHADRLVLAWERNLTIGKERDPVAPLNYQDWRSQSTVFDELGAYRFRSFALDDVGDPEQLRALSVSSSVFPVLGVSPTAGRVFTEEEERRQDRVVVLAHALWQRRFGGSPSVIGRSLSLNGAAFTIVGVMPSTFAFPDGNAVDLYSPLVFGADELNDRRSHVLFVIGRLKPDVTVDAATADLRAIAQRIFPTDRTSNPDVTVAGAHDVLVEDARLGLIVLFGTVGFVLLIACANVASLLLVRGSVRRREVAMRAALGAGRGRLLRQLLTESVLLAIVGAAAGVVVARGLLMVFARIHPPNLPRVDQIGIDGPVLLFVTVAAVLTGVAFGIIPALQAATPRLSDATKVVGSTYTAASRGRFGLVASEVALALMLAAGAGLMIRSVIKLQELDLGFAPAGVLSAQVLLPAARYPVDPTQSRPTKDATPPGDTKPFMFFSQLEARLRATAGIESVGAVSALPLNPVGTDYDLPVIVDGKPRARPGEELQADFRVATVSYFRTMRIPLIAGREFTEFDGPGTTPVAIINDTLARQIFPGENPVGQRLRLYGRPREIVGVVGSVRHHGFTRDPRPEMVLPYRQFQFTGMTVVVRSQIAQLAVAEAIRGAVQSLDPQQPVNRVTAVDELLADSVAQPRFTALLLGGFAVLALVLAVVGVYGVMSYTVGQRAREIAVRMTLGARRSEVARMIVGQAAVYVVVGVIIGLVGALAGTRLMTGLLFGVAATDPATLLSAAAVVIVTSLAASSIPAIRAACMTPVAVLRSE